MNEYYNNECEPKCRSYKRIVEDYERDLKELNILKIMVDLMIKNSSLQEDWQCNYNFYRKLAMESKYDKK